MGSLKTNRVVAGTVLALIALAMVMVQTSGDPALAQQAGRATPSQPAAAIAGISRQPSEAARQVLLDPHDTVVLLLDHQTGLFHIPSDLVVESITAHRKPPEVRIWRFRNQSCVGTFPPLTSTPYWPACVARR